MQRLLDIMTGLRKVRENVPKEEAIVNVLSERRDMVSFILDLLLSPPISLSRFLAFASACLLVRTLSGVGSPYLNSYPRRDAH
jgi:hypothetical protein